MDTRTPLTSAHVISLPADGTVPEWVHLLPANTFNGRDGRGPYRSDVQSILSTFAGWGADLVIDYEHQSLNAIENGQPAPAAAWIKSLEDREGEIWGKVEWTKQAAQMVADKQYRYLSPVFDHLPDGTVIQLSCAGLTNNPNLYLTAINRREGSMSVHSQQGGIVEIKEIIERLRYLLNLPTLTTPEGVVAELDKLKAFLAQPETAAMRQALKLPETAGLGEIVQAAHGRVTGEPDATQYVPRAEYDRVAHSLATLQQSTLDGRVEQAVTEAMSAGKVAPASAAWARSYCRRDPEGFAAFVASAPVLIPGAAQASHAAQRVADASASVNPLLADADKRSGKAAG